MGFFNFEKPGPGVSKDLYESPAKIFFSVFSRKFFKMVKLNLMYFVSTLPLWILLFLPKLLVKSEENILLNYNAQIIIFMIISIIGIPVFNTGFAYILRNFSRQNHAWIWHDFWQKIKSNLKQSIALTFLDLAVFFMSYVCIVFYSNISVFSENLSFLLTAMVVIAVTVYYMMHYYIYAIMVTFDLSFGKILINSFILTFTKLPRNVGITILIYLIGALVCGFGNFVAIVLLLLIACIFVNYLATFNAVSIVDKYLMPFDEEEDN